MPYVNSSIYKRREEEILSDVLKEVGINLPKETLEENKKNGRCSGHCCVAFTFMISRKDIENFLQKRKEDPLAYKMEVEYRPGDPLMISPDRYPDEYFEQLIDMLIDQDREKFNGVNPAKPDDNSALSNKETYPGFFTCKHLDRNTGNCNNYENRPDFCQNYPYDKNQNTCHYEGCTSSCAACK